MTARSLAAALTARRCSSGWIARCPAHKGRSPSLSICEKDGKILVHCFAGCSQRAVLEALRRLGLWPERQRHTWSPSDRLARRQQRLYVEKHLPVALLWRRIAVILGEEELDRLKDGLRDDSLPQSDIGGLPRWTAMVRFWQKLDDLQLVEEYRKWQRCYPRLTKGMVRAARNLELAELRAILQYINAKKETSAT